MQLFARLLSAVLMLSASVRIRLELPSAMATSFFTVGSVPTTLTNPNVNLAKFGGVELGLQFQSSMPGQVTGLESLQGRERDRDETSATSGTLPARSI